MGHLKQVLENHILLYDELKTLLVTVEACVNSRPLIPLSSDSNDLSLLTPAHFLVGKPLCSFPVPDYTPLYINRLTNWQRTNQMYQNLWKHWSNEYLSTLQQCHKCAKDIHHQSQVR
ncbi:uncharacterized protein LOC142333373 [Lycorma delicatula]|uniref:uncharacterized protein LOC142333373 n=1 Tax=Lycorma delicatula TaxID=130591 RepID=UPI003F5174DD